MLLGVKAAKERGRTVPVSLGFRGSAEWIVGRGADDSAERTPHTSLGIQRDRHTQAKS